MNYQETLNYLYESTPMFQQVGSKAYKEGLENTYALDNYFGHPHRSFRVIHVAGTNGKGSCSHTLASILQEAGYKVGLYTSPHLVDFRERIRIDGTPVPEAYVVEFVEKHRTFFEPLYPSFFELTTAMAFRYFADSQVEVAVIEVGLGGRLDCTNIVQPDLCLITNISPDHTQFLGDTLDKIAAEKAGIIKADTPVVVGETTPLTRPVFEQKAAAMHAPLILAEEEQRVQAAQREGSGWKYDNREYPALAGELGGLYQVKNTNTLLSALHQLHQLGYKITEQAVRNGFAHVCRNTGLMGRWQTLQRTPLFICDTGHNVAGIGYVVEQLRELPGKQLHIIIGMVNDKDINGVLALLPQEATYYFTKASVQRALPETELMQRAAAKGLHGNAYPTITEAVRAAQQKSLPEDVIFAGGSSFIVADLLANRDTLNLY